ncbi:hypothetical protein JXB27_00780, partial [Candidatus Woesearchaeota archaeon]|nr:hypothetical protein [Candidatus Woesearchaeota archaeon]
DEIINNSVGGSTTFDVLGRFKVENPDLIIFAVGLNDSSDFEGEKRVLLVDFKKNIETLIKQSKAKTIFVGLTPVDESKSVTEFEAYVNDEIHKYDILIKEICKKHKITFVEVFDKWMKLDYKKLLADGVHSNEEGHKLLFEEIIKALK